MKFGNNSRKLFFGIALAGGCGVLLAEPIINSWYTERSGRYASIWETIEAETLERSGQGVKSVTTWSYENYDDVNSGSQDLPVYAGIQGVSYSDNYVYIKSTGLATSTMGPWFSNSRRIQMFTSFPENAAWLTRFPRNVSYTSTYTKQDSSSDPTGLGLAGLSVDGVALYDSSDGQSYSSEGIWNQDAYHNEGWTLDSGFAHQAGGRYHYHTSSPALRYLLGDSMDYDSSVVYNGIRVQGPYTENFNGTHSPIIGWMLDGLPLYGPYGYSDPLDSNSSVRRMISGYQMRDGTNGSENLSLTGRVSLPLWVTYMSDREQTTVTGPTVEEEGLGRYYEDYAYKGDLVSDVTSSNMQQYTNASAQGSFDETKYFDLNAYNVRWCVTPEFPAGTWAYFTNITSDGAPFYPYNLAKNYWGDSSLASSIQDTEMETQNLTIQFDGATSIEPKVEEMIHDGENLTLTWVGVQGGSYRLESSDDLTNWDESRTTDLVASEPITSNQIVGGNTQHFYRLTQIGNFSDYDTTVFSVETSTGGGGGGGGGGGR